MNNLNLDFSNGLPITINIVPLDYELTGSTGELLIRDSVGDELYRAGTGITVMTITLNKDLIFCDGTIKNAGTVVQCLSISPDLSGLNLANADDLSPSQYRYGITINDDWGVYGLWTIWPDAGPNRCNGNTFGLCCNDITVAVNVCGITTGGVDGSLSLPVVLVQASTNLSVANQTVSVVAGGEEIDIVLPDPVDMYDNEIGATKSIWINRPEDDADGIVNIAGNGPSLPDVIWPGESYVIQSTGVSLIVIGPF